ncbi:MAG: Fic family protein [Planctomycetes bacterium]|nr:Fic family protein [Planctomycetota bacterium]
MPRSIRAVWTPQESPFGGRRSRASYTYDAFVPDSVAAWDVAIPPALAAEIGDADAALRAASADVSLAGMEALSRHLLRAECIASSRIEGLVVSHRRIAEVAFDPTHADETARSVLGNIAAMERAIRIGARGGRLTVGDLVAIHRELLTATRDGAIAGKIRGSQNWIGGRSDGPLDAEFVPPPPELVPELLDDLAQFCSRDDLPTVLQAAIAHAQFETIHPFADGNGRVGRCLIHVVLRRGGHAGRFVPPVSLALAGNAAAYVKGLGDFRRGDSVAWIGQCVAATRLAAVRSRELVELAQATTARWMAETRARRGSALARAIQTLPECPVLDAARLATTMRCDVATAHAALTRLSAAGIVTATTLGRRNRVFVARACIELLNKFERSLLDPAGPRRRNRAPARPPTRPPRAEVSPAESSILRALASASMSLGDLRARCELPSRRLQALLAGLRTRGLVRLVGRARTARWSLTAAGRSVAASS